MAAATIEAAAPAEHTLLGTCLELMLDSLQQREDVARAVGSRLGDVNRGGRDAAAAMGRVDVARAKFATVAADPGADMLNLMDCGAEVAARVADAEAAVWEGFVRLARQQRAAERKGGAA